MAERRMLAKSIITSDAFLDMPLTAQMLYVHLSAEADDEGFVNSPKRIQRMIGATDEDFKQLEKKRFILTFESGVIAIKHWKINNSIRTNRLVHTKYQEELAMLEVKSNLAYTFKKNHLVPPENQSEASDGSQVSASCHPSGVQVTTKCPPSIGKDRVGKDRTSCSPPFGGRDGAEGEDQEDSSDPEDCGSLGDDPLEADEQGESLMVETAGGTGAASPVDHSTTLNRLFEKFWEAYPKKLKKAAARKRFERLKPTPEMVESMLEAIAWQKETEEWRKEGGQFVPHPTTWLNQRRWEDERPVEREDNPYADYVK